MFNSEDLKKTITNKKVIRIGKKVGTSLAGGVTAWGSKMFGKNIFFVVSQEAYYKFNGNAQIAILGKKNVDYFEFKTASAAVKKANELLK